MDVETARLDAEAEARSAAAEWLRGQTGVLQRETEKPAKPEVGKPKPDDDTAEQKAVGAAESKVGFLRRRAEARRARRAEKAAEREKQGSTAMAASQAKSSSESNAADSQPIEEKARPRRRGGPLDVNKASFEQFRELGMSVTEATRVIAYRERRNGFQSVDDLDAVPGLSKKLIKIRDQLTA
jgi:DNA uptake protein ComE-like DNA-binding protein